MSIYIVVKVIELKVIYIMSDSKVSKLNEDDLLAILQSVYIKGEKSIINNPKEMVEEIILLMKSVGAK